MEGPASSPSARNLVGALTFDGAGGYQLEVDPSVPDAASYQTSGSYEVAFDGALKIDDPARGGQIHGQISADGMVIIGSANEASGWVGALVAVRSGTASVGSIQGSYTLALFELLSGASKQSALASFDADGAGGLAKVEEIGHRDNGPNTGLSGGPGSYQVGAGGALSFNLPGLNICAGVSTLFASQDGNYLIGVPEGSPGLIVAARRLDAAPGEAYAGLFSMASIGIFGSQPRSGLGTAVLQRDVDAIVVQRQRFLPGNLAFTGRHQFLMSSQEGYAWLSTEQSGGAINMSLAVADADFTANAGVGAGVALMGSPSEEFGVFVLIRPPLPDPNGGLFADYRGVVDAASFARPPSPLSPGGLATVFGSGLVAPGGPNEATADSIPLPRELAGVRITVDNVEAPLLYASDGQVNFQVPIETPAGDATIRISNGAEDVTIIRSVAAANPGLFSRPEFRSDYAAIVSHADGTVVTPASPARRGETVVFWATGFGRTNPPVPSGTANPGLDGGPLAIPIDADTTLLVAGEPAVITYVGGTPGFAGLFQINAIIPSNAPFAETVPVAVASSDAVQDLVDMPILGTAALSDEAVSTTQLETPPRLRNLVRREWNPQGSPAQ